MPTGVYKRKPFTEKARKNMSKNHTRFWLGKKMSKEHKKKISDSLIGNTRSLGYKQSLESILKSRETRRDNGWYKHPSETKKRQSKAMQGKKRPPFSREWLENLSKSKKGEKAWNWKGGITPEIDRIRKSFEMKNWRISVFKRDNYTCLMCKKRGVYLEAHHIKRFNDYPELRFEISNGITLCSSCHNKTKFKEELYEKEFYAILDKEQEYLHNGGRFITIDGRILCQEPTTSSTMS